MSFRAFRLCIFAFVLLCTTTTFADEKPVFRAGAATSNITPLSGENLVGGFSPAPLEHIHDELHARCLVLDDGKLRLGIVVCDNLSVSREVCDEAKRLAKDATGLETNRILISATHTHSGPSARPKFVAGKPPELNDYQTFLARRIADGLMRAVNNLAPAKVAWGVGTQSEHVFNRRWYMKSAADMENPFGGVDQVRMNPPGASPNLIEPAGPTDPQVSFISVQSTEGRPIALLANYSLHYVGGTGKQHVSADYFGMFADRIQQLFGADRLDPPFVGIMSNGTSGDINNINFVQPRKGKKPYEQMRYVANAVAEEVFRVHKTLEFKTDVPLGMVEREMKVAVRKPTSEMLARAAELLSGKRESSHRLDKAYAQRITDLAAGPDEYMIILQALRIGKVGIATSPFETFCETGLELRSRSPWKPTFTIELANGGYGYLPTPEQHRLGGYETWLGTNRVEIQASRKMTEQLVEMLEVLHKNK